MKTLRWLSLALITSTAAFAASGWGNDYEKALAKAKEEKKLVLLDFTGSDWCSWCMKLDKEVFSKKEFKDYAKDNLILVEVDFPQTKHLSNKVAEQNAKLQSQYKIQGFPSIVVLNSEGQKIDQFGYEEGGPAPFIARLDQLKKK